MTNKTLLPPSSTKLEKRLSQAMVCDFPILLRSLWNPQTCPYELLPYLAWQYSVDYWDENWNEQIKRKVVAEAFEIHQHKGTKEAIRRAVSSFGYLIDLIEWWQNDKTPGTFSIEIGVLDKGITDESYNELVRIIEDVKPVSRHLSGLSLHLATSVNTTIGACNYDGNTISIYPYVSETVTTKSRRQFGASIHFIDTMRI
ncbi:phage tail protein I [Gilliamella sp. wkB195]|uniref:phage tail protein I n=1 Tax=Gilliamella sp. wkB195 TaxID=3120261 RepID=UPI00080E080C|nr:phage tail protein I [Gilliamella apicola]OCF95613.1 phage tail protein I [Gilliamella apicola]OCF96672.1 phage tail protein I [Gilliamella apicola]OCG00182.1 phage tail protein I [Gilliamella apicola]